MEMMPATRNSRRLFIATILTGSFLLFMIQPMVARMALPRLGGAPAVWNSAMLVYQALLLGGYAYAHWLSRLAARHQAMIHIGLLLFAALWLPLGLAGFAPPKQGSPVFWVPWLLVASIGPLFFAVAAQAPLMQRWYNLAGNKGEPYALYAASNIGSFTGLIAYPLIVEPMMPLRAQNWLWTSIYVLLFFAVAACGRMVWRNRHVTQIISNNTVEHIDWRQRLYWVVLAAVPSGLMLSTTTHLTTDLVAMPLVWVIPLGLYLISFSIAFADSRTAANVITFLAPPILLITGTLTFVIAGEAAITGLAVCLTLLIVVAVALHSEMYRTRPDPEQLTSFYLMMSLGGVFGGIFCAIIAPLIFDWTWEHPILILFAALLLPQTRLFSMGEEETLGRGSWVAIAVTLGLVAIGAGVYGGVSMPFDTGPVKVILLIIIMTIGIIVTGQRIAFSLVLAAAMFANGGWYNMTMTLNDMRMRSYFGTYTINSDKDARWLSHGTTMHGMQLLDDPKRPISYYGAHSGVGIIMAQSDVLYGKNAAIGIVGLGTGTLSCYAKQGQSWQFFEIDPLMIEIARGRHIFSFLDRCTPSVPIHLGDARLTLAQVKPASLDILAIDAFSSDAIPLHLMTSEAFAIYKRALKPGGILLVHISNRYIDLNPVVAAQAKAGGWHAALRADNPLQKGRMNGERPSQWIAMSQDQRKLTAITGPLGDKPGRYYDPALWLRLDPADNNPWTDDYASVLPHLSIWKIL
jgi:SAM-dependent methyltransferase